VVEKATLFEIIYFEEIIKNQGGRNPLLLQNLLVTQKGKV
jgi:hypothetical protein